MLAVDGCLGLLSLAACKFAEDFLSEPRSQLLSQAESHGPRYDKRSVVVDKCQRIIKHPVPIKPHHRHQGVRIVNHEDAGTSAVTGVEHTVTDGLKDRRYSTVL